MKTDSSKKVLIVDDDSRNIFALRAVLESKGFDCIVAYGGNEGIKKLEQHNEVGVVLLDMMMPEMDGYETIGLIRQSDRGDVPVISVTAQAMVGDREKCLAAGANAYIAKPIDVDRLIILLDRYLKQ
jgi:two-component system, cell cycle response regulator DivK